MSLLLPLKGLRLETDKGAFMKTVLFLRLSMLCLMLIWLNVSARAGLLPKILRSAAGMMGEPAGAMAAPAGTPASRCPRILVAPISAPAGIRVAATSAATLAEAILAAVTSAVEATGARAPIAHP